MAARLPFGSFLAKARAFLRDRSANTAMMFGLSLVPILIATGAGIDFARGVMLHQNMLQALDAAALAVGNATSKPASCSSSGTPAQQASCADLQDLAQRYFNQNFKNDTNLNADGTTPKVGINIDGQAVTLDASLHLKLTLLGLSTINVASPEVKATTNVVWGQTKLWVALVLDNSGSMDQGDRSGSKMDALKDALNSTDYGLLQTLKSAAAAEGDVRVAIAPFAGVLKPGLAANSTLLDWAEWEAPPRVVGTSPDSHVVQDFRTYSPDTGVPFSAFGPGDDCPFTDSSGNLRDNYGFYCTSSQSNSAGTVDEIPDSGSRKGYICPGRDYGMAANGSHNAQYYNGCWTSTKASGTVVVTEKNRNASCSGFSSDNCKCTGNGSNKYCYTQKWSHSWFINDHSTWDGCIVDRQRQGLQTMTPSGARTAATKSYDTSNDQAATNKPDTLFPAANPTTCLGSAVVPFPNSWTVSQWTTLKNKVTAMDANGSTNQAIGLEHGWHLLTAGTPYSSTSAPANTSRVIILFSDGLNTQDRWWGNGSTEGTTADGYIDDRTSEACTNAKKDGVVIYTIYVHIGSNGNSSTLEDCATDKTKYYDLTSSADIKTAFKDIAQKITNLRVAQ